jgi:hypothetical protein
MTSRRILPPQMLLEIAETGGSIPADMKAIAVRFGMPRRRAAEHISQLASRELLARNAERLCYDIAPKGWAWVEAYNPTAARPKPSSPQPPLSSPPAISPAPPSSSSVPPPPPPPPPPKPLNEVQRIRLGKQLKQMRALARLRGVTLRDLGVKLDRPHDGLELGIELGHKPAEYQQLKIMLGCFPVFLPAGFSREEAKKFRDDFNRPRRTAEKRRSRKAERAEKADQVQTVAEVHCRASAIYTVLTDQYQTMDKVACSPAFRTADGNSLLTGDSLKKAIRRALKEPTLAARVEIKRDRLKNGRPMDLFRRRQ